LLVETDIHVVPSRWDEPIGLTVLEGMAAGLAVVGTACGGIPEVIWNAGRLVPREDAHALAAVLEELIADPGQRVRLGAIARERALKLSWDATWAALIESGHGKAV
jgi:glycosyltransferase involved in cell wall biosynthesis